MSAVRYGESPQNTEVLVGALIPKASVPVDSLQLAVLLTAET